MMRFFTILFFCLLVGSLVAQPLVSPALQSQLNTQLQPSTLTVNVYLSDRLDLTALERQLDQQPMPVGERAREVQRALQDIAHTSQERFLTAVGLGARSNAITVISQHWLVNMISLEADPATVRKWTTRSDLAYLQLYDEDQAYLIEPVETRMAPAQRSPGGVEPGLLAIKADELWQLGYSGHGQKALIYDTGIRMNHPAVKDRFLYFNYPGRYGWNPIDKFYPADKSSTHGTHVAGTVLGLDPATQDTIGVAPGARFMATDPIVDDLSKIKALPVYISVYEWIFNPDDDTSTTNDVPIVINNSWGLASSDTTLCNSFASDMFDALQAAGIAVVFSAGNNGPGPATVGRPAFINSGLVNVFSVGALNGNDPNYPIANFSSRGPTICPGTGQLKIKPEVSAPGFQVRSAVFDDQYALYNGTSMAAPHVSGAVLLLAEAYPMATGKELLEALYWSAVDLGTPGEDNTFGRGIIDVKAAFDTLAQTYTPVAPMQRTHDLAVTEILSPDFSLHCIEDVMLNGISVEAVVANIGQSDAIYPEISLWHMGHKVDSVITSVLVAGTTDTLTFTIDRDVVLGLNEWVIRIDWSQSGLVDYDAVDNQRVIRFDARGDGNQVAADKLFPEDFDTLVSLYQSPFLVEGDDDNVFWLLDSLAVGNSVQSLRLELSDYLPRNGQRDAFYLPEIESPIGASLTLQFDYYYRTKASFFVDSLSVQLSEDCGQSWQTLWAKWGTDMNSSTVADPTNPANWRTVSIPNLNIGIIRLMAVNDNGGDIWIDNLRFNSPSGVNDIEVNPFEMYPNPATDQLIVSAKASFSDWNGQLSVVNLAGQTVLQHNMTGPQAVLNLKTLPNGMYLLQWQGEEGTFTQSFVKQ